MSSKKKSRSSKSSKSKSETFSVVDPLTGTVVNSDVVYGPETVLAQSFIRSGDTSLEFEFSRDKIILNQVDAYTSQNPYTTNPDATRTTIYRWVLDGSFKYSKDGKLTGTLGSITRGMYTPSDSYGISETIIKSIENRTLGSNSRLYSHIAPGPGTVRIYEYANKLSPYSASSVETNKERLAEMGLASFYPDAWWNDPFTGNLI